MRGLDFVTVIGLFVLAVIDVKKKKIPVWFVGVFSMVLFIIRFIEGISLLDFVVGLLPGVVLLILAVCSREKIGIGDGLVLCALGIGYSLKDIVGILGVSFFITAIWAIALLILKRANRKTELPFLPCLFIGYLLVNWIK